MTPNPLELPPFAVIYADPPWRYENRTPGREIERHYQTMTDAEIEALYPPADTNAVLYLWATAPRLDAAMRLIDAWGFRYRSCAVWDKMRLGIGYWWRVQHELLLVGVRGKMSPPPPALRKPSVLRCHRGRHSSKPDQVRVWIETWYPNRAKLEMFSRIKRPGWAVFGNEVETDLLS